MDVNEDRDPEVEEDAASDHGEMDSDDDEVEESQDESEDEGGDAGGDDDGDEDGDGAASAKPEPLLTDEQVDLLLEQDTVSAEDKTKMRIRRRQDRATELKRRAQVLLVRQQQRMEEAKPKPKSSKAQQIELAEQRRKIKTKAAETSGQETKDRLAANREQKLEMEKDKQRRFKYLLNSEAGELYSHFVDLKKGITSPSKKAAGAGDPKEGRKRKTEKEEDAELLAEKEEAEDQNYVKFTESPAYIEGGTMRDYQVRGLNWMVQMDHNGINGILADEMGLGKTLQSISLLGYLKHFKQCDGPHLVIVPKSTHPNWCKEFRKWCPSLRIVSFVGNKDERANLVVEEILPGNWDVVVSTYETVIKEKGCLRKFVWRYIMIDEAHRIKNENATLSRVVREFDSRHRLLITGTPLQNNLHELWALLNFILPDVFGSDEDFDVWFNSEDGSVKDGMIKRLHGILKPFMMRRLKAEVEKSLLPKKETKVYVGLSEMQTSWYKKVLSKEIDVLNGAGKSEKLRLLNILMQLRKNCNHPYLFDGAEPGPPFTTDQHLIDNCGKMAVLDKLLVKLKEQGSRVLIFSQMTRMLDILEDYCFWKQLKYFRLDGQTEHGRRQEMIEAYNAEGSEYYIFMLSTRAGGLGINLYTADVVILYDSDWNPQMDLQAQDRAHRIGQKKQVRVFRLVSEGTVEERIIEKAEHKLRLDALVIQSGRLVEKDKKLDGNDMLAMIQFGAEKMFKSKGATITDDDIDAILARGEEKTAAGIEKLKSLGDLESLQSFTFDTQTTDMHSFQGQDFKQDGGGFGGWIDMGKRERKTHNYNVDVNLKQFRTGPQQPKQPKPPKQAKIEEFQFHDKRLKTLMDQEVYAYRNQIGFKAPKSAGDDGVWTAEDEEKRKEEQEKINSSIPLTEEEVQEQGALLTQGFNEWGKKDFNQYCKACERWGRDDVDNIALEIESKTEEEVKAYHAVFWERHHELAESEKILTAIKKGEEKIIRRQEIQTALDTKMKMYRQPFQQLRIQYGQNKGKNFTEEEDRYLVCMLHKLGYESENCYERLRREVRSSPAFRFDWFIKSRTSTELQRRCTTLINLIENEIKEMAENEKKKKPNRKRKADAPSSANRKKKGSK